MRAEDRRFCDSLVKRIASGGDVDNRTLTEAGLDAFRFGYMSDELAEKNALRRAKRLLRRQDVRARISGLFSNGGFEVTDAVREHVRHIRNGNYQALKDYWTMTQGPMPKQVQVKGVVAHVDGSTFADNREPKPIKARSLTGKEVEAGIVVDGTTGEVLFEGEDGDEP